MKTVTEYRHTLTALTRESSLIEIMEKIPDEVELSSLPKIYSDGFRVTISVASKDKNLSEKSFKMFIDALEHRKIPYSIGED